VGRMSVIGRWSAAVLLAFAPGVWGAVKVDSGMFGAIEARSIGPAVTGGRIMCIDAVASDPRIIYVGTASGGLWKSMSGGTVFKPIFDKYTQSIGAIAIDQNHPDRVWVGTGESRTRNSVSVGTGLYKTTDGGDNWALIGLEKSERISKIVIHPKNSDIVYVAVPGHLWDSNEERGVYKTKDGGKSWEQILKVNADTGCADLATDPQEPDTVYAAMWQFRRKPYFFTSGGPGSGIHKSTDGGATWRKLSTGLPAGDLGRIALAVAPTRPSIVYATVEAADTALYRSDDFGETWKRVNSSFDVTARPFYFSHLIVDPKDYKRVYKPGFSLSVSSDGGDSFSSPFTAMAGNVHSDLHALWINPSNPFHLLLGTDGGVYLSVDRGNTWTFLANMPVSQFYHVSCDMQRPYNVYGGLQDNGSWMGPSRSPGGIENSDWRNLGYGDGFYVLPDPLDTDIIYWSWQGGGIERRSLKAGDSKDIKPYPRVGEPTFRFNWNTPVVLSPRGDGVLYVGAQFVFRSADRGESWERISPDLTTNDPGKQKQEESGGLTIDNSTAENHCTVFTIGPSPLDEKVIWAGTDDGNLQLTRDGGKSWTNLVGNIPGLPAGTWCASIEPSRHNPGTAYVAFDGHQTGDMKPYAFVTTDFGETWTSIVNEGLKGFVHVIREDPAKPDLLYAGTEFGLYVTIDGGAQWAPFTGNLPPVPVFDIVIHPREHDLILATHGRGILIVDDITPLRQITTKVLDSPVHIFTARPTEIRVPQGEQRFAGDAEYVGPNPGEAARITYYLKERLLTGDFKIEISDSAGTLLKTLPGSKRRGINIVRWNMRRKPPKVPAAPVLAGGALAGPMLPEGTYSVTLVKGTESFSGKVDLIADPASPYSVEDRTLQQKTVLRLYGMQEQLAYVAECLTNARDQARENAKKLTMGDALTKSLEAFAEKIDRLHTTLVATKPGLLTGEERLRERVVDLYSSVSQYGGRPTVSQLSRMDVLSKEILEAEASSRKLLDAELIKLNDRLTAKKLTPIKLPTKEEWTKKESEG